MSASYNFYQLCGKSAVSNRKILEELRNFGVEISSKQLRERLTRAVTLGYMIRKAQGHMLTSKICDRHVIKFLGSTVNNDDEIEEIMQEKLFDDINSEKNREVSNYTNRRTVMTMTEKEESQHSINRVPNDANKNNERNQINNSNNNTADDSSNCFLQECWQQVGSFIEGLDKKQETITSRTSIGRKNLQKQPLTVTPSTSVEKDETVINTNETTPSVVASRKSLFSHRSAENIMKEQKESVSEIDLTSQVALKEKSVKLNITEEEINRDDTNNLEKSPNKQTDYDDEDDYDDVDDKNPVNTDENQSNTDCDNVLDNS